MLSDSTPPASTCRLLPEPWHEGRYAASTMPVKHAVIISRLDAQFICLQSLEPSETFAHSCQPAPSTLRHGATQTAWAQSDCVSTGRLGEEAVLVHVDSALQRVGTSAVAAHACLTAGLPQWLGIALAPKHDRLEAASIQVTLLGHPGAPSSAPGKGPVSLEAEPDSPGFILPLSRSPGETLRCCPVPVSSKMPAQRAIYEEWLATRPSHQFLSDIHASTHAMLCLLAYCSV